MRKATSIDAMLASICGSAAERLQVAGVEPAAAAPAAALCSPSESLALRTFWRIFSCPLLR
jgi:hypothetical protein